MNAGFMADEKDQLKEIRYTAFPRQTAAIRLAAKIISYIFHPVFVPLYMVLFMVYVHPWFFAGFSNLQKFNTVIMAALMFTFFPIVTVLLLKGLDFIKSIYLNSQKDRIIPLIACGIWYWWLWNVWRNLQDYPGEGIKFALAIWISAFLGLMANIIMKVSLHAISMGVMLTFILLLAFTQQLNFGIYISVALLITGAVCTSRFIVSDHFPKEVYGGLFVGIISMLAASLFG